MNRTFQAFVLGIVLISSTAFAGGSTGGGNVVICERDRKAPSVQLLDYYEAGVLMPETTLELGRGTSVDDKIEYVLKRFERLDRTRADHYRKLAAVFLRDAQFVTKVVLPDIKDHDYVPLNPRCRIEQVAVQYISPFPQTKKYTIRKEYWDELSVADKAGLILHEVIYEEALALGQKTSRNARYFNALISSRSMAKMDKATYEHRLGLVGFGKVTSDSWSVHFNRMGLSLAAGYPLKLDLRNYVMNPAGAKLTFYNQQWIDCVDLKTSGIVEFNCNQDAIGMHWIGLLVTDGVREESVGINLWIGSKKELPVIAPGDALNEDVFLYATHPTFGCLGGAKAQLLSGPSWITLNAGKLQGSPARGDMGDSSLKLRFTCSHEEEYGMPGPDPTKWIYKKRAVTTTSDAQVNVVVAEKKP